jgi:hypothetical protein
MTHTHWSRRTWRWDRSPICRYYVPGEKIADRVVEAYKTASKFEIIASISQRIKRRSSKSHSSTGR